MGHALGDSSTYTRFYMTDYNDVDFQEIVFGSEPQRDLIHLMGRLLRHGDAPKRLTEHQKAEVNNDPKLAKLRQNGTEISPKSGNEAGLFKRQPTRSEASTFSNDTTDTRDRWTA